MNEKTFNALLCIAAAILSIILGFSSLYFGFIDKESPCVLCWAQRFYMLALVMFALLMVRYGPKPRYLGAVLLTSAFGIYAGIRHSSGSFAWDIHQGWWTEIFGIHTYTWTEIVQWFVLVAVALMLLVAHKVYSFVNVPVKPLSRLARGVFGLVLFVTAANMAQAFMSTGLPPNVGTGDPARISFNPKYWNWSTEFWGRLQRPVSLRGAWDVHYPDLPTKPQTAIRFATHAADGPVEKAVPLQISDKKELALPFNGAVTDLAYNGQDAYFMVTEKWGLYLVNNDLTAIERSAVLDQYNGANGRNAVGATFFNDGSFGLIGWNKVFVYLKKAASKPEGQAAEFKAFHDFTEGLESFNLIKRAPYLSVRARMMHALAFTYDADNNSVYTITVPSDKYKKIVVSRFDKKDDILSEEFFPVKGAGLTLKAGRSLDEYYVTGLTYNNGRLYALSKQYSSILVLNPTSKEIETVYSFDGVANPQGITFRDGKPQILGYDNGKSVIYTLSAM